MGFSNLTQELNKIVKNVNIKLNNIEITDELLVDLNYFNQKKWKLRLHDEYKFNWIDIDLFVQGLNKLNIHQVEIFLHNNKLKYFKKIETKYKIVKEVFFNIGAQNKIWEDADILISPIIITNKNIDFIVIIDKYREKFYFFGNNDFISKVIPVSNEAYKNYFESLYEIYEDEPSHTNYLNWLQRNYNVGAKEQ